MINKINNLSIKIINIAYQNSFNNSLATSIS